VSVPTDFEAEGLLGGIADPAARAARLDLLRSLEQQGFSVAELRSATDQDRLVLLPMERVLEGEGARRSQRDVSEEIGLPLGLMAESRRAMGLPAVDPDDPVMTEDEVQLARSAKVLLDSGLEPDAFFELTRVMSQAMAPVASALTSTFGDAVLRPGDNERDLGLRYAETLRNLGPLAGPALTQMLNLRLREAIRSAAVGEAELASGHLPGSQPIAVGFVDIVGFTRLGEEIDPEELGAVVRDFERSVARATERPVRLVKTIGDAAMLVAPTPEPVIDTVLGLVEESRADESRLLLRGGIASGDALQRAGDWYGRPVNLASRLTSFARRGSVVASGEVHDAVADGYAWSFAGNRRLKGFGEEVPVWRVRPAEGPGVS
jgi:adenylate cyclase